MKLVMAFVLLAACSSAPAPGPMSPPSSTNPGPAPGATAGEPAAPTGPTGHAPVCATRIAIKCVNGVDGCLDGRTLMHHCVAADAKAGPPCEQEIALVCGDGQTDACLKTPRVADKHICVY